MKLLATRNQLRYIESLARDNGMSYSDLDAWLTERYGATRATIGKRVASAAIDALQARQDAVTAEGFRQAGTLK